MSIPRNPSFYQPSIHAVQRKKDRDIPWDDIADTIETGEVNPSHKTNCKLFVKDVGEKYPIGVVANTKCGEILTVQYRRDND